MSRGHQHHDASDGDRRLFFALWPDRRQRTALEDRLGPLVRTLDGRVVARANWHVTLAFLGNVPASVIPGLADAANAISVEPFTLRFDRFSYWPQPKIACLEALSVPEALRSLVGRLGEVAGGVGIALDRRPYRPHITAMRPVRPFESRPLAHPLDLRWSAFELVESVSTGRGVRYRPLKQRVPGNS